MAAGKLVSAARLVLPPRQMIPASRLTMKFSPVSRSYRPCFLLHTTFVQGAFSILSKHRNGKLEFEENKERIVEGCQQAGCGMAGGSSSSPPRQRFCRGGHRVSILTAMTGM